MSKHSESINIPQISFSPHELGNFDLLVEGVFKMLTDHFGFVQPALAMFDETDQALKFVKNQSHPIIKSILKRFINKTISDFSFPLVNNENILVASFLDKKVVVSQSMVDLAHPTLSRKFAQMMDHALNLKSYIVTPITFENKSIGVIAMGSRLKPRFSQNEKQILLDFSSDIGVYVSESWKIHSHDVGANHSAHSLLQLDKNFLRSAGNLLMELAELEELSENDKLDINSHIEYLKSLILIHDNINEE